ncbi:PLAC8-domain-containing protein [Clathrospora elynae]|uniref:PLAC8-domain-containing protein n=1 Tax=Clathrospora elynae TaxID=706981 RepID=A0A6A5SS53_9PLEO|nr:PLAC8-domain-containing protein [Clathrospora elynae]
MDPRQQGQSQHLRPQTTSRQHNRFSWQPHVEEEAPTYEETQQQAPQHPSQQRQQPQRPQVSTDASRHFSYAQTPAEMRAFVYAASPTAPPLPQSVRTSLPTSPYTPIDPRPQSILDPRMPVYPPQSQTAYAPPPSHSQDVKYPVSPSSPHDGSRILTLSPVSPILPPQPVQQRPEVETQQSRHARQLSNLSPINTNLRTYPMHPIPPTPPSGTQTSPLPHKTPMTPLSPASTKKDQTRDGPISPMSRASYANEPYSPHGFSSTQTNNLHAVFSPDAVHGPNGLDFSKHQPGQISHPNMESETSHEWKNGLCACSPDPSTCLTGLFCPCVLYGRTSYRLSQKSAKKDPTDMLGHSSTNGHCMVMGISCGLGWLFPMLQRTRIRRAYKLGGSFGSDLLRGCCCCCCVAVQNEREVKSREEASRRWAGPASTDVYTRTGGMVYKPQQ